MLKFIVSLLIVIFIVLPYINKSSDSVQPASGPPAPSDSPATAQSYDSPLAKLGEAKADALSPQGEIAEIFSFGSDFTDLQRQLKLKEIKGKVIEWRLPVYEVKQSGDGYLIQTSNRANGDLFGPVYIGTRLRITPRSEDDRRFVERIKTGDFIKIKGVIEGVTMRHLDIEPAIIVDVDEEQGRRILGKAYDRYLPKHDCWHTVATDRNGEHEYCMKLARLDRVQVGDVKRIYILALGKIANGEGESVGGGHADSGMVGTFVAEIKNGQAEIVASNTKMPMGEWGTPPEEWKLTKLGPADYWGWQSETGGGNQGYESYEHLILAPYGRSVKNLAGFGGTENGNNLTYVEVELKIDSSSQSSKVYPLLLEVKEGKEGRETSRKTVKVPFDEKQWKWNYKPPSAY